MCLEVTSTIESWQVTERMSERIHDNDYYVNTKYYLIIVETLHFSPPTALKSAQEMTMNVCGDDEVMARM